MSTYSSILFFSIIIPFVYSFHPKIKFYKQWPAFMFSTLIIAPIFILWDIKFTQLGIWGFNQLHISGFKISNLPLEECLFFLIIPYCCIFTYEVLSKYLDKIYVINQNYTIITAIILFVGAITYKQQSYTFSILIGNSLIFCMLYLSGISYEKLLNSFLILLIPFFIVNGLLTGSLIQEEVVWYNSDHIWNIRIGTIPIEDSFYFSMMFFSQVILYEYFKKSIHNLSKK